MQDFVHQPCDGRLPFKGSVQGFCEGLHSDSPRPLKNGTYLNCKSLGFRVPYFNTFFLKETLMKEKFILFSPWLPKSPGQGFNGLIL